MDLIIGIAIGTAFAPFWIMLYNKLKPVVEKEATTALDKVEAK